MFHDEANDLWGIATYDGVRAAGRDAETFSSALGSRPEAGPMPWMIDMDGADHSKRRRLVSGGFTPGAGARHGAAACAAICDELIDRVCERGECDVVGDLAAPLPMIVIGDMLGVAPGRSRRPAAVVARDAGVAHRRARGLRGGRGRVRRVRGVRPPR